MPAYCVSCKKYHSIKKAVEVHGCSAIDSPFIPLVTKAFEMGRALDQAKRLEERGTMDKENMYLSDSVDCILQLVRTRRNVVETNPPDIYSLMNFQVGHAVQAAVSQVLSYLGGELIEEAHLSVEHPGAVNPITSRSDILIDIPAKVMEEMGITDERLAANNLLEIKATGDRAMTTMISNGKEGNDGHRRQTNRYIHASKLGAMPNGKVYEDAWLTYVVPLVPKGEPSVFPFYIPYNAAQAVGDLDYIAHAEKLALSDAEVPMPPEYAKESKPPNWPCRYCPTMDLCWPPK